MDKVKECVERKNIPHIFLFLKGIIICFMLFASVDMVSANGIPEAPITMKAYSGVPSIVTGVDIRAENIRFDGFIIDSGGSGHGIDIRYTTIAGRSTRNRITFSNLPKEATIKTYTVSGDLVKTIKHKDIADGGSEDWDISGIASGVYIYTIISPEDKKTGKISIIR